MGKTAAQKVPWGKSGGKYTPKNRGRGAFLKNR